MWMMSQVKKFTGGIWEEINRRMVLDGREAPCNGKSPSGIILIWTWCENILLSPCFQFFSLAGSYGNYTFKFFRNLPYYFPPTIYNIPFLHGCLIILMYVYEINSDISNLNFFLHGRHKNFTIISKCLLN